jgi:hypothetical protein
MKKSEAHRARWAVTTAVAFLAAAMVSGCSIKDDLLEPQQPQIISPDDIQSSTGAEGLYVGGLGRLRSSLNGGNNNQEQLWNMEGLMTDEFKSGDTFSQRNDADQRRTLSNDGVMGATYNSTQQSRGRARDAINALTQFTPEQKSKIAEMYWVMGFMELNLAQAFCNGIPLGEVVDGQIEYTAPLTNAEVYAVAIARFDTALTLLGTANDTHSAHVRNAVLVSKGMAQVNLGQFAAAATTVAAVPTSYQYLITYSQTSGQDNEWWQMGTNTRRYTLSDSADATGIVKNALPFASANDPRVKAVKGTGSRANSFDNQTPFVEFTNFGRGDPIAAVAGLDARLIEAEAKLQANDFAGMMTILNALRTSTPTLGTYKPANMTQLATPTTKDAAINLYFREKAFWQFGRGQRLPDLRRLVRQYGRSQDNVFPSGPFFKTGTYSTNVAFPVPDTEKSNPNFSGCLDDKA